MKTIQHDTQSLRHMAIERYLRTCDRIERQHRRDALGLLLIVLMMITVVGLAILVSQ